MSKIDAVVMAGGTATSLDLSAPYKGAVTICGKPMAEWVIDALRASQVVNRVVLTVPFKERLGSWADKVDDVVVTDGLFSDNAIAGIKACGDVSHVLIATGDIPAVTPAAITEFVTDVQSHGAKVSYPFIPREAMERTFPGSQRTYFKFDGGSYTAGNAALVAPDLMHTMQDLGQKLFDSRKNPLKLASIAGPGLLMKFASGTLTKSALEKRTSEILGVPAYVFKTTEASLGADVDKPADMAVTEHVLGCAPTR